MAGSITNVSEIISVSESKNEQELTYSERLLKTNKIKYYMGLAYFASLTLLLTALIL